MSRIKVIFLDAAGTMFHLRESVGHTYASYAARFGIEVEPDALDAAFRKAWKSSPAPLRPEGVVSVDDDRSWWAGLVALTFETACGQPLPESTFDPLFDALYDHFERADAWRLYDDTREALTLLQKDYRLAVLSNFDRRLQTILTGLEIDRFFEFIVVSSDVGASKPHPRIFEHALRLAATPADQCLHIGDELDADHSGAKICGIQAVHLQRPANDLLKIAKKLLLEAHSDLHTSS